MRWLVLLLCAVLNMGAVVLEWDANPETNVAYKVYVGRASRSYQTNFTTTNTSFTIANTNLFPSTNYFAVTAFYLDDPATESEFSNEVSWTAPRLPLRPPLNLRMRATNAVAQIRLLQSTDLAQYWRETGIAFAPVTDGMVFYQAAAPAAPKAFVSAPAPKAGKLTAPPKRPVIGPPPMP